MGVLTSVITLISSTVGVAVLAMPYCFQQCGILLSIIFIALCAFTCSSACDILITLCLTHRSLSLEKACFRHLGLLGKLVAELSVMGLMVGCVIGYDVSLSDLGTRIFSEFSDAVVSFPIRVWRDV
ncbi:uncharacterized protein DEA37_0006168 [Paragonimus westermani]|uniref:Amino acid transporter transmembrane domain-containing protein n=1 Tax=Paragonimus westermani TaxID=34504 RepID=A0A5J4N3B8_9TREM|nr:uncharacterized protein DEA37_0006168 [Paragonimus westermani]